MSTSTSPRAARRLRGISATARHIGISADVLDRWRANDRRFPRAFNLGGRPYLDLDEVEAYLEACREESPA